MRVFIAFKPSEEVKREFIRIQKELKQQFGSNHIKWVDEENVHGTLLFVGEVPEDKIPLLDSCLLSIAGSTAPLDFQLDNISAFPNLSQPKVLVVRLIDFSGRGAELSSRLAGEISACGFVIDKKPWKAHLTLGRVKTDRFIVEKLMPIKENKIKWRVDQIELVKSDLGAEGPKYTVINNFQLKK